MIEVVYPRAIKVTNTVNAVTLAQPARLYNAAGTAVTMTVSFASTPFISALSNATALATQIEAQPLLFGADTTLTAVTTTALTGVGSGLTVDVTVTNTGTVQDPVYEVTTLTSNVEGDDYKHDDLIRVNYTQTVESVVIDCSFNIRIKEANLANKTASIILPANEMTPFEVVGFDVSGTTARTILAITS